MHKMGLIQEQPEEDEPTPTEIISAIDLTSRKNIVGTIIGHPKGMPSFKEKDHMNPSLAQSTISEHLKKLQDTGVVASISNNEDRDSDSPQKFYYLTEAAREIFDRNGIFGEEGYKSLYAQTTIPDDVKKHQEASRPDVDASTTPK